MNQDDTGYLVKNEEEEDTYLDKDNDTSDGECSDSESNWDMPYCEIDESLTQERKESGSFIPFDVLTNLTNAGRSVGKLKTSKNIATAFLVEIAILGNSFVSGLLTCNHILTEEEELKKEKFVGVDFQIGVKVHIRCDELIAKNKKSDIIFIPIHHDKIDNYTKDGLVFAGIDTRVSIGDTVHILQFPKGGKMQYATGEVKDRKPRFLLHTADTDKGSSGSPIFSSDGLSVVGIHKGKVGIDKEEKVGITTEAIIACVQNTFGKVPKDYGDSFLYKAPQRFMEIQLNKSFLASQISMFGSFFQGTKNPYHQLETIPEKKGKNEEIAENMDKNGLYYFKKNNYQQALKQFEDSLKMRQEIFGTNAQCPEIAESIRHIAMVYKAMKKWESVIEYNEMSINMERAIFGLDEERDTIAFCLRNIAYAYNQLNIQEKAVDYYEESIKMRKSLCIDNKLPLSDNVADSLINLGYAYGKLNKLEKAKECYEESIKIRREIHGKNSISYGIARGLHNIGVIYKNTGKKQEAEKYFAQENAMIKKLWS